ncbi:right-handed parallel beta-helix repeat-containing protein [Phosphitispora sp. TUW77]|uniref:right-handed parallel beta-helix repeat-containing protein n=1 Tax=Phosphitispora sp. TUW77 TaxID=3152361 RepID=UPI003AB40B35
MFNTSSVFAYDEITLSSAGWSEPVGTWDPDTLTGVLTHNVNKTIHITSNGITLDGGGYTITGDETWNGILVQEQNNITITNINVSNCLNGILLSFSDFNTITGTVLTDNVNSNLFLSRSEYNTVTDNYMSGSEAYGILLREFANSNVLADNEFIGNLNGIALLGAQRNSIYQNTVRDNSCGIFIGDTSSLTELIPSIQNQVFQNNFIDNNTQAYINNYVFNIDNMFFMNVPKGGNYWSTHISTDSNSDGFADTPYSFYGGQDNLPWMIQDGWESASEEPPVEPAHLYVYLGNNGWSEPVGTWDSVNRTATLTQDVTGTIIIMANEITLEGNGHTVSGDGNSAGIQVSMHGYITVRNVQMENHRYGILMNYAYDSIVENNVVSNTDYGFYLFESRRNTVSENQSYDNTYGVSLVELSDDNQIIGNEIYSNDYGVDLPGSFENIVTENTIRDNAVSGLSIRLHPFGNYAVLHANRNQVYHNDFINNTEQASIYDSDTDNIFNLDAPEGGNYWSDHVSIDNNSDGFADTPYVFSGGQDNLPWMTAFGWHEQINDQDEDGIPDDEDNAPHVYNPSQEATIAGVLEVFDRAVLDGTLEGNGDAEKLAELREKLVNVSEKLAAGKTNPALHLLNAIYAFIDGAEKPKDLVVGVAAEDIAKMITELIGSLEI